MFDRLSDISQRDLDYLFGHPCDVIEKLDMFKFILEYSPAGGFRVLTTKNRGISDGDRTKNFIWNCIDRDIESYRIKEGVSRAFSGMWVKLFLFYDSYRHLDTMGPPFIFGHAVNQCGFKIIEDAESRGLPFRKSPVIAKNFVLDEVCKQGIEEYVNGITTTQKVVKTLLFGLPLPYPDSYAGVAIRSGKRTFFISDSADDVEYTFHDFAESMIWKNYQNVKRKNIREWASRERHYTSYDNMVADEFLFYLEHTDIFKTYKLYEKDLLAPYSKNYELDYSLINNKMVEMICRCNGAYRMIYKIFFDRLAIKTGPLIIF